MYVPQIVQYINSVLQTSLSGRQFQSGKYFTIAKQVVRKDEKKETSFVVIFDNDGNEISDIINDTYPIVIYHRMTGQAFFDVAQNQANSFGDGTNNKGLTSNMVMVVYGDRKRLKMTQEELSSLIYAYFPAEMLPAVKSMLTGLDTCTFAPLATNNVSIQVAQAEGIKVEPENILFALNYQIKEVVNSNCLSECEFTFDTNNVCFELCAARAGSTLSVTFLTQAGVNAYPIDELLGKQVTFVLYGNMPLIGVSSLTANPQFTKPQSSKTWTLIDTAFDVEAGTEVTIGYK